MASNAAGILDDAIVDESAEDGALDLLDSLEARGADTGLDTGDDAGASSGEDAEMERGADARASSDEPKPKRGRPRKSDAKKKRAHSSKATGTTYKSIRNVQNLQALCAAKDRELATERERYERELAELRARAESAMRGAEVENIDELAAGFAGILVFVFDTIAETTKLDAWRMPDAKAAGTARALAQFAGPRLDIDVAQYIPLAIGIAGIGTHVTTAIKAARLERAEPAQVVRIARNGSEA